MQYTSYIGSFFFRWMASISFASESLMDPRIQVKLDKYQKCGNIISQTSLLSSYTGSETDADSDIDKYSGI